MELVLPNLGFLTSSIPLEFNTDGYITSFQPTAGKIITPEHILILTDVHVQLFNLKSVREVSLSNSILLPESLKAPQLYDGTQDLCGKRVLILMQNGWGDTILIQPALRAFYEKAISSGGAPRITLGCNWIHNFPYPCVPYIQEVRPNILTLKELCSFDLLVDLIPVNHQRSLNKSMKDLCLESLKLNGKDKKNTTPFIFPDKDRVARIKQVISRLRMETGKKLLCVNWKSRFHHKNAQPSLFFEIVRKLSKEYQAVLFKDAPEVKIMQEEIDASHVPVKNLSHLINDYHDTVAALSLVDAFISVDTGIVHAAGALGVPGVALFGPFPPETHIADYPSITGFRSSFNGKTCKAPCLETHRGCAEVNFSSSEISPCFQAITPDSVIEAFDNGINKRNYTGC